MEIAQLVLKGRVRIPDDLNDWMVAGLDLMRCKEIGLKTHLATAAYVLPGNFHADPADRLIVATARAEKMTLVTADSRILEYPHVLTLDARE